MGQQGSFGGSKPGAPPNPNYGSGAGTDNSNGVYNTSAALQSASAPPPQYDPGLGTGGQTSVAAAGNSGQVLETPTNAYGATGATGAPGNYTTQTGATGAPAPGQYPNGAAFAGARPAKGQGKGMTPQAPAGMQGAATTLNGALAGGPTGQPPPYSTSYVPPPAGTTTAPGASSPMSGSSLQLGQGGAKGGAKGGTPGAPAGTLGSLLDRLGLGQQGGQPGATGTTGAPPGATGVPGATGTTTPGATGSTGAPRDWAAESGRFNAQNDPTGKWAQMYNQQQQGKQNYANAPKWMSNLLHGVGADGSTNASRAAAEQAGNPIKTNATYTNWEAAVKKMTGQPDAWEALRQAYAMAKFAPGGGTADGGQGYADIHRALLNSGINKETADRVHEMFSTGGSIGSGAARRLGADVQNEWIRRGGQDIYNTNYDYSKYKGITTPEAAAAQQKAKELRDWHAANPTGTAPGATGATGPPDAGGPTGVTGPPGPPPPDVTNPPPPAAGGVVTPEETAATPGLTNDRVQQIAQQYMVSPEIAKLIYKQILQQSQGSGGGDYGGSGGGGGDGGSY